MEVTTEVWRNLMRVKMIAALLGSAMALSACAGMKAEEETAPIPEVDQMIAEAVEASASANQAISEVEVATSGPLRPQALPVVPPTVILPPEALQPVTIDWQGPIEGLIADLARRADYTFRTTGNPPVNQKMVSVVANEEPIFGVMRRVGAMAHGYADVAFNPTSRVVEIRYGG